MFVALSHTHKLLMKWRNFMDRFELTEFANAIQITWHTNAMKSNEIKWNEIINIEAFGCLGRFNQISLVNSFQLLLYGGLWSCEIIPKMHLCIIVLFTLTLDPVAWDLDNYCHWNLFILPRNAIAHRKPFQCLKCWSTVFSRVWIVYINETK